MRAWIFGAVDARAEDILFYKRLKFGKDDLIICADGGYNTASLIGITPSVVIGDMDSVRGKIPESIKKIVHPKIKDKTDMHLCIDYALDNGYTEIIMLCAFGGRIDHSLASVFLLRYIIEKGAEGMLLTKRSKVFAINGKTEISRGEYSKISLIPLTDTVEGVTTTGLQYALEGATLYQTQNLGISNAFCGSSAEVQISRGILCIVCEIDE